MFEQYGLLLIVIVFLSLFFGVIGEEIKKRKTIPQQEEELISPKYGKTYLEKHPSSFYFAQLKDPDYKYFPYRKAGPDPDGIFHHLPERNEHFRLEINGPVPFQLIFQSVGGELDSTHLEKAKHILRNIVEMDQKANNDETLREYLPELIDIEIEDSDGSTIFHYCSGVINTEWWIVFKVDGENWICEGFG